MISTIRKMTVKFAVAVAMAVALTGAGVTTASAAPGDWTTVAKTAEGKMKSKIAGETSTGRKVTGSFTPRRFVEKDGVVWAKGVVRGHFKTASGATKTFKVKRLVPLQKANGTPMTARAVDSRVECDVLNQILGRLNLGG